MTYAKLLSQVCLRSNLRSEEGNVLAARGLSVSPSGRGVMGPRGSKGMIREQVTTCSAPLKCRLSPTALVTAIALATSPWQRAASKKAETGRLQTGFGGSRRWLGGRLWTNIYLPVVAWAWATLLLLAVGDAGLRGGFARTPAVARSVQSEDRAPSEEGTCVPQFPLLRGGHGVGGGRQMRCQGPRQQGGSVRAGPRAQGRAGLGHGLCEAGSAFLSLHLRLDTKNKRNKNKAKPQPCHPD